MRCQFCARHPLTVLFLKTASKAAPLWAIQHPYQVCYYFRKELFKVGNRCRKEIKQVLPVPCKRLCRWWRRGWLTGARLGKEIDSHSAVFRYDGGPSTPKYASDVGNRTTFQVLSSIWAEVLLGEFEDGLHVSRWWSDTATVVFWSERSYQQYVKVNWFVKKCRPESINISFHLPP